MQLSRSPEPHHMCHYSLHLVYLVIRFILHFTIKLLSPFTPTKTLALFGVIVEDQLSSGYSNKRLAAGDFTSICITLVACF